MLFIPEIIVFIIIIIIFGLLINFTFKNNLYFDLIISFLIIWILFVNVNPYTKEQNKYNILSYIPKEYVPKQYILSKKDINITYPLIYKPNVCTGCSEAVAVIHNELEAQKYISDTKISLNEILVQEFIPYENEVGILFERNLFNNSGEIKSIVKRNVNKNSIVNLDCETNKNACKDLTFMVTPELNQIFLFISNSIPNFNVGRFDVKYKDLDSLLKGKDFYILEANGTMGFNLSKNTGTFISNNKKIFEWIFYRIAYGFKNIISLKGYNPIEQIDILINCVNKSIKCSDWENIFSYYN